MSNIWSVLSQGAGIFAVSLLVLTVQKIFADKLNPKWQSYLWWVVIIICFVPVDFLGTASFFDFKEIVDSFKIQIEMGLNSAYSSAWVSEFINSPFPKLPSVMPNSITDILFIAYILWVILSAIYFVLSYMKLKFMVSKAVEINLALVNEVANKYNLPVPYKVLESKKAKTPFVMGIFHPKLVLPLGEDFDEKVIIHELIHLRRKDILLGIITTALRCLHPCLWYFCNQMDNDRERACDQSVLELLEGEQRRDYGRILLSMVNNNSVHTPGATAMANGGKHIKKRIASIVNFRKFPKGMELVSFCMIFVLMMTVFGGTATSATEFDSNNYASAIAFGQNNKATTAAAALDFYTTGKYQEYWRKYQNLAYLSAVTEPSNMEEIYLEWKKTLEYNIDNLDNAFRTGPIIRGLSLGDNGDYICEVYFFRDEFGENFDVRYRKTIVSLKETDGYWTVTELAETEDIIAGDDTMYLKDNHSSVVWSAEFDGYTLEVSSIGMTCVNAPFKNGYNLEYQYAFRFDPNSRLDLNTSSQFWAYDGSYYISITNENDKNINYCHIQINLEDSMGNDEKDISFENILNGETIGTYTGGAGFSYINNITLEDLPIVTSATATVEIDGVVHEVELTREVILP